MQCNTPTFRWKLSYMGGVEYEVHDETGSYLVEIAMRSPNSYHLSVCNGDDVRSEVKSRVGILRRCSCIRRADGSWTFEVRPETIAGLCIKTTFGLLCSEEKVEKLEAAFTEARRLADEFNGRASTTQINVFVIAGRVAADDVEAMRAINSEVRELMQDMETGLQNLDAKAVRDAAKKARLLGSMLSDDASERVKQAIETARKAANDMVKAAETSSAEIDLQAIRKITESRTAFLDITGDNVEIAAPVHGARALDFEPTEGQGPASAPEVDEEVAPIAPAAPAVKVPQLEMD
ncbi:hypothetical protein [Bradyrhizobium sp. 2S1]|uniref:hypothetical protein n=1 Tax=Bradyrhizobium sp. 2S1 TaxID=1404429 RepID=UPI001409A966|nr:hypothetical protein [Bradyrhizobium sp. 2S1]MCK7671474.1 hypothetical protein [Bradyrhizobium sp. 2S1]